MLSPLGFRLLPRVAGGRAALLLAAAVVLAWTPLVGCAAAGPAAVLTAPAKQTVVSFLEAIKRGDDATARSMLTATARAKTEELGISVAPPVNDSATYAVRECEAIGDGGDLVHVATTWTDVDPDGFQSKDNVIWVVRLDPEGWRVVGMAMRVFDDLPPLLLNFECSPSRRWWPRNSSGGPKQAARSSRPGSGRRAILALPGSSRSSRWPAQAGGASRAPAQAAPGCAEAISHRIRRQFPAGGAAPETGKVGEIVVLTASRPYFLTPGLALIALLPGFRERQIFSNRYVLPGGRLG